MSKCPRCGGQIVRNYDDVFCFQCSWRPVPEIPDELDKTYPGLPEIRKPDIYGMSMIERSRVLRDWLEENSETVKEYVRELGKIRAQGQLDVSNYIWAEFLEKHGLKESVLVR
jgi:hypothetical protein